MFFSEALHLEALFNPPEFFFFEKKAHFNPTNNPTLAWALQGKKCFQETKTIFFATIFGLRGLLVQKTIDEKVPPLSQRVFHIIAFFKTMELTPPHPNPK